LRLQGTQPPFHTWRTDGQTDGRTDRRTDGQGDSYIPPKLCLRGVCIYFVNVITVTAF